MFLIPVFRDEIQVVSWHPPLQEHEEVTIHGEDNAVDDTHVRPQSQKPTVRGVISYAHGD